MKNGDGIRFQIGLEATCRGFAFRAGLAAEAIHHVGDEPLRHAPEGPEIFQCGVPHRGSESPPSPSERGHLYRRRP